MSKTTSYYVLTRENFMFNKIINNKISTKKYMWYMLNICEANYC